MLQLLAMITMLIDHIGLLFYQDHEIFRVIGRIAFPTYCFLLVEGYNRTKNVKRYMTRLLGIAVISQLPYSILFLTLDLNVVFTLLLGLLVLYGMDRMGEGQRNYPVFIILFSILSAFFIPMDYGIYGILLILIYRYAKGKQLFLYHLALNIIFLISHQWVLQLYSIVFTVFLVYYRDPRDFRIPNWLYRSFYPAHLVGLLFYMVLFVK
ncbi:TraX family protein [Ammoniphilus resinae]|uniref:Conjugal transfer protein TraX n=1 Tax=Ammoniphilus resinae TaxID=861532 RepID=A0ABS4GPP7_9BACL|nr:TraX family protein [Ammoniphilus resinae]MBP1931840.1 hypothetical protein [Ammoniphilus resinae]